MGSAAEDVGAWRRSLLEILRSESDGGRGLTPPPSPAATQRLAVVGFELGSETYGVEIGEVAEVLLPRALTPLPRTPAYIRGVLTLRGMVLPVLDLAGRLGVTSEQGGGGGGRILVLRDGDERLGFWVDRVCGVLRFTPSEVETTGLASPVERRFLKGIGYGPNGSVVGMLSTERLCQFDLEEEAG